MHKKTISLIIICLLFTSISVSFCAEEQGKQALCIPTGRLLKWSKFHKKYKSVNGIDPEFVYTPGNDSQSFDAHLRYDAQKNQTYLITHCNQTEYQIPVRSASPNFLRSLQYTRMHGQSAGNVGAIDNLGNKYTITHVDIDWEKTRKKYVAILPHDHQVSSDAILYKNAVIKIRGWYNRWEIIKYSKQCGDEQKVAKKWFHNGCLEISNENTQKISEYKKAGTPFIMQIVDPCNPDKKTFFEIMQVAGAGDILRYNMSCNEYHRIQSEGEKQKKNFGCDYMSYVFMFTKFVYHPATLFTGIGALLVFLAHRYHYSLSDIVAKLTLSNK